VTKLSAFAFADGVTEPLKKDHQKPNQTCEQRVFTPLLTVDPLACAQDQQEQPKRSHGWMP
jgi:hypothetical protein